MQIEELINKIYSITDDLYKENINIYKEIVQIIPSISNYYQKFIGLIPQLANIGIDINTDDVVKQLKTVLYAVEKKDKLLLYDAFKYEIVDTLCFYKEILDIMKSK